MCVFLCSVVEQLPDSSSSDEHKEAEENRFLMLKQLFAAVTLGVCSVLIVAVNKIVLTSYK